MQLTATKAAPVQNGVRTQAERTARSDACMLDAAVALIVERGPAKTTLKSVGERAGYSRGLAGYRFGSRDGLFSFVLKSIGEEWLAELKAVTAGRTGLAAIEAAADAHYRFCVDAPDHVRAFYLLWFDSIGPDKGYREVIAAIHERRRRDVIAWIEVARDQGHVPAHVSSDAVAAQFCASIIGIVYQWLLHPESLDRVREMYAGLKHTTAMQLETPDPGS